MDNKRIKKEIERLRLEKNLSQSEIADMLGISQPSFHKLEKGETILFNEHLEKICEILGISEEELLLGYRRKEEVSPLLEEADNKETLQKVIEEENTQLKKELESKDQKISELNAVIKDKETIINILFEKSELQKEVIEILKEKIQKSTTIS